VTTQHEFDQYARAYEPLRRTGTNSHRADSKEFLMSKLAFCQRFTQTYLVRDGGTKTFLDYGCGTGRLGQVFHDRFDSAGSTPT